MCQWPLFFCPEKAVKSDLMVHDLPFVAPHFIDTQVLSKTNMEVPFDLLQLKEKSMDMKESPTEGSQLIGTGWGRGERAVQILFIFMAVFVYTLTSQLSSPDAVATQGKSSAWEVAQKVTGLPTIGILALDRQVSDQIRE